jgi:hypothetical protein
MTKTRATKWAATFGSAVFLLTAAVGALHLPAARPWLRRAGGCPVPRATAAQVEEAQARAFGRLRGRDVARVRPALGFGLEIATSEDVLAWARRHAIRCGSFREGALLLCNAVPISAVSPGAAGTYDELAFGFRLRDSRLVNLTALRTGLRPDAAGREVLRIAAGLEEKLGQPSRRVEGDPATLLYRRSDYLAEVSAMSLRERGHALREHYMAPPR